LKYLLAVFFVFAGANHFRNPDFYLAMMPPYLPWHVPLVYLSGVPRNAIRVDAHDPEAYSRCRVGFDTSADRDLSCQHLHGSARRAVPLDHAKSALDQAAASTCVARMGLLVHAA
jgi:hypothetical protein